MADLKFTTPAELAAAISGAIRQAGKLSVSDAESMTMADGYSAQAAAFFALGQPRLGSKLALKNGAPIASPLLWVNADREQPYLPDLAIEVEYALELGRNVTIGQPTDRAAILDAIGKVYLGVELVQSRYVGGSSPFTPLALSDFLSNAGYILGPELPREVLDQPGAPLLIRAGDDVLYHAPAQHVEPDPLAVLMPAASEGVLPDVATTFTKGQILTTGTLCGIVRLTGPGPLEIVLGGQRLELDFKG